MNFIHKEITVYGFLSKRFFHGGEGIVYCVETEIIECCDHSFSIKTGVPKVCTNRDDLEMYRNYVSKVFLEKNCGNNREEEEEEKKGEKVGETPVFVKMVKKNIENAFLNACGCKNNDISIVEGFIDSGIDINCIDESEYTGLMLASYHGNDQIVDFLLKNKAKLDLKDDEGETALMSATRQGFVGIVRSLLEAGANMYMRDCSMKTALSFALTPEMKELFEKYK